MRFLYPDWDAPAPVKALVTTRSGGVSTGAFSSFDLALHAGGDPEAVQTNRKILVQAGGLPAEPFWLNQVHGTVIAEPVPGSFPQTPPQADGAVTSLKDQPLAILTADCLPILACNRQGTRVGAFHAGWKGLAAGILSQGLKLMGDPEDLLVWIGPAISGAVYQVGDEVRQIFTQTAPGLEDHFQADGEGKWLFDLPACAETLVKLTGVRSVTRSRWCTYSHPELFFSYRRAHPCGRQASLIWLT